MGLFDMPAVSEKYHVGSNPLASVVNQFMKQSTVGYKGSSRIGSYTQGNQPTTMIMNPVTGTPRNASTGTTTVTTPANSASAVSSQSFQMPTNMSNMIKDAQEASASNSKAMSDAWSMQNKLAMDFNASEAAKNRDWQEYMSNTAHQREVQDLMAAGLNPILSATGGNGASTPSGASASMSSGSASFGVDSSLASGLAGLLGTIINAQASMHNANVSAAATLGSASTSANASKYASDLLAKTSANSLAFNEKTWLPNLVTNFFKGAVI